MFYTSLYFTSNMSKCRISLDCYTKLLRNGFSSLQQSEEFVDMTLAADGHLVKVHKNLVALASPFIKEMIQSAQCAHPVIFLANISKQVLSYILEYIYTGEVDVPKENVDALAKAGRLLHIYGLETLNPSFALNNSTQREHNPDSDQSSNQQNKSDIIENENAECDTNIVQIDETNQKNEIAPIEKPMNLSGWIINNDAVQTDDLSDNNFQENINNDECRSQVSESNGQGNNIGDSDIQMQSENDESVNVLYPKITVSLDSQDPNSANIQIESTKELIHASNEAGPVIYYTLSIKGSIMLVVNRYIYNLHHTSRGGRKNRWRCTDYRRGRCKAYIDTFDDKIISRKFNHEHPKHDEQIMRRGETQGVFSTKQEALDSLAERAKQKTIDLVETTDSE